MMQDRIDTGRVAAGSPTVKTALAAMGNHGPGFDTIRLAASSLVVLHHSMKIEMDIVRDDYFYQFSHGYIQLGLLSVAVFFCLSGFLVVPGLMKHGDVIDYLSRRFMRIMPLLCAIVVATAFLIGPLFTSLPVADYLTSPQTWRYLKNVTTSLSLELPGVVDYDGGNSINGPMWTLRHEWTFYFVIAGASILGLLRNRFLFLMGCIAAVLLLWFGIGPIPAEADRSFAFIALFLFSYFGAGVLVFLYADTLRWSPLLMIGAFVALLAVWRLDLSYFFAPFLTAYLVVGLGLVRFPWSGLLAKADLSYGVYLTHSVILMMLMHLHDFTSGLALFAVCLPLSYLVAICTWTFIEKPALRHKSLPGNLVRRVLDRAAPRST